jgi:hypothetical protein
MSQVMIGLNNSPSQIMARQRVESLVDTRKLFAVIDSDPGIVGAGVVYIDADFNVVTLREFTPICSIHPKRVILREAKRHITPQQFVQQVQTNPRESRLVYEALNTTLSCGGAILGWITVLGGGAAAPFTAGTSAVIAAAGMTSAVASTAQCVIGMSRTYYEITQPDANDAMNDAEWYQIVTPILDVASLTGVAATGLTTVKYMQARKAATGRSWYDLTKELNRQQRKALTTELLKLQDPTLTNKLLKLRQRAGLLPVRMTPTELRPATVLQMQDVWSMAVGLAGSGSVQSLVVGLYEEIGQ